MAKSAKRSSAQLNTRGSSRVHMRSVLDGHVFSWEDDGHALNDSGAPSAGRQNILAQVAKEVAVGVPLYYLTEALPQSFVGPDGMAYASIRAPVWAKAQDKALKENLSERTRRISEAAVRRRDGQMTQAPAAAEVAAFQGGKEIKNSALGSAVRSGVDVRNKDD